MARRTPNRPRRRLAGALALAAAAILAAAIALSHPAWSALLFDVTGEESLAGQARGTLEWLGNITRRQPQTANWTPIANAGVNPFGVNTFLQEEVEPAKRQCSIQMIADAGFHWIRQEFPWEDIEIHGKGDFEDRRHEPYRSAWEKYDQIVELAERYGLEMIVRLSNPPAWSRAQGNAGGTLAPPDNLQDYGDFVEAVARRYRGRIRHYQIWNEPNIYPEWGEQPVSPEAYTALLKVGYSRVKAACPECVVISGALAQTIPLGPRDLNDFVFLQRMYDAGAADYFDVLAMQGYGLWSGPTDRRMRPRVLNFSRPLYLREIMVKNGDAAKPIWITEMNWNSPPADLANKQFGYVTLEQQARYAVLAYQRAQEEWPWVGVVNFWFFKRATDTEVDQAMYYFRMVEPDFTPMPVYQALQEYAHRTPVLYPGVHQEDHWALTYTGSWISRSTSGAELGAERVAPGGSAAALEFRFQGTEAWLKLGPGTLTQAVVATAVDGGDAQETQISGPAEIPLAQGLPNGLHTVSIRAVSGSPAIDSLTIRQTSPIGRWLFAAGVALTAGLLAVLLIRVAAGGARRRARR